MSEVSVFMKSRYIINFIFLGSCCFFLLSCESAKPIKSSFTLEPDIVQEGTYQLKSDQKELSERYFERKKGNYLLAPGDRISIKVFENPDLYRTNVPIAPDGRLYYLLVDPIEAAGYSSDAVARKLEKKLEEYLIGPRVNMLLTSSESRKYLILGKVKNPGIYEIKSNLTLIQAIASAGGFMRGETDSTTIAVADLKHAFIARQGENVLPVDFFKLVTEGDPSQNILVEPNDFIFIPSSLNQEVYILGEVNNPRAVGYSENMTLVKLIAGEAGNGGYTDEAFLGNVIVLRGSLVNPEVIVVDLKKILDGQVKDIVLMPKDIVYVPARPFRFIRELSKMAVETFVRKFATSASSFYIPDD